MRKCRLSFLFQLTIFIISTSFAQKHRPESKDKRLIYEGDSIYLLKPKAIVRKHFGEKPDEFQIDTVENESASLELAEGIKLVGEKKVQIVDLTIRREQLLEFYKLIKPFLDSAKRDTVNLEYNFSLALKIISNSRQLKYPIIVPDLEWDYDTKKFYNEMRVSYSGFYNGNYFFEHRTTFLKMHFVVIDPMTGVILKYRYSYWISSENREPVFEKFESDVKKVMRPFLQSVVKKEGMPNPPPSR